MSARNSQTETVHGNAVRLLIGSLRVKPEDGDGAAKQKAKDVLRALRLPAGAFSYEIFKCSIDARHKEDIRLVYTVMATSEQSVCLPPQEKMAASDVKTVEATACQTEGNPQGEPLSARPLVVGMGPAGMFCALLLAEAGYEPILIDRGDDVEHRVLAVDAFKLTGVLDTNSNIQFGAGGAGTFSDGKLLTRISDARCNYVLERFVEFGAPQEICTRAKPHVGTDVLRTVVENLLRRIESAGGQVRYRTRLTGLRENADGSMTAETDQGEIVCGALVLALGHSARDTYRMLIGKQFSIVPKPMSVGVRIEHLQEDIDRALYGKYAGHPALGHAEYALSDTRRERGVYTFCMCPGGQVIHAASEEGGVVVNGMSHHARDGKNANCAVAVSVNPSDYGKEEGNEALGAIAYQRAIEQAAFRAGGSDYSAPIQTVGDFLGGTWGKEPTRIRPTYRDGQFVRPADLATVLPPYVTEGLRYGLQVFDRKIKGFAASDAILSGVETRTSAPVRILRDEEGRALGHKAIYPCGEGAGYAGGITSAAVDGIRTAQAIMQTYKPLR